MLFLPWFPKEMRLHDCVITWRLPPPHLLHFQPEAVGFLSEVDKGEEISKMLKCCNFSEN